LKVALVAMSGLRAYDPELTRLGLTLPGFVERSKAIASLPSLGLLTIAGMTPPHIELEYYEVNDVNALKELPDCDLAAISTFSMMAKDAYALSERFRARGTKTVMGGLHATALPDEARQHCDIVVVGEGESSWPRLIRDFEAGHPETLYTAEGREFDFADAPMPRFDLLDPQRYNRLTVQTQRGCPWHCDFCASSIMLTSFYKKKPVRKVIEEIRAIKQVWNQPYIEFADDNTFVDKAHGKELMRALAKEEVKWFTETDISVADDPELLALMRDSGCAQILIGLESPTAEGLDGVELKTNWKHSRFTDYMTAIERIQSHGIAVNGCFVLGLDGDTPEVFERVLAFVEESGLQQVQITVMTAFPGTPLYDRLLAEGRLLKEGAWERCTLFDVNIMPKQMSLEQLRNGFVALGRQLYSAEGKKKRDAAFRRQLRRSPDWRRHRGTAQ
jgi:radical SAM superfamily enzyme YgiQ (UPF0313 family)